MTNPITRLLNSLGLELRRGNSTAYSEFVALTTFEPRKGSALLA
jgi:hypothetical protein